VKEEHKNFVIKWLARLAVIGIFLLVLFITANEVSHVDAMNKAGLHNFTG
jgi:hypothetical protein